MADTPTPPILNFFEPGNWEIRLKFIVETMREMSQQTDPQTTVRAYGRRMRQILPSDASVSLSRRDLAAPKYRITRSSKWDGTLDPWKNRDRLPVFDRGLLGKLIYGDEPVIIDELEIAPDDPAREHFDGMRSLTAIPLFDKGVALNMVVLFSREPHRYKRERLPEHVWMSNLFGRATQNLVLSEEVRQAYHALDREMRVVADIQRSLLPVRLPEIPGVNLAAHYQTSQNAGGDYYDFFPLPGGKWGILIADVSGHGTPAAVFMAVTHSIAHTHDGPPEPPGALLSFINRHLTARYTNASGTFVTAFYGIYDPAARTITHSSAGHPIPRIKHKDGTIEGLDGNARGLPLGIDCDETYRDVTTTFAPGDVIVFYTDGITEAHTPGVAELFGTQRLDDVIRDCQGDADLHIDMTLMAVDEFTDGAPPNDDRTLLVARLE
jgi:sigma-B regulation protein RsbU (phosphoserine phosphatase)